MFGQDRLIIVARELTKTFEACYRGSIVEIYSKLSKSSANAKGNLLLFFREKRPLKNDSEELIRWLNILLKYMDMKDARYVLREFGLFKRNMIYENTKKKVDLFKKN